MPAAFILLSVPWMPPDGAQHGPALDRLLGMNLAILFGLFVISQILMAVGILRRKPRKDTAAYRATWSRILTSSLIIAFCALYAWMGVTAQALWEISRLQQAAPTALQVEVVGEQFAWYFRYPGPDNKFGPTRTSLIDAAAGNPLGVVRSDPAGKDDIVSGMLVLPAGQQVDLHLRSLDVIHGFFVPGMRIKLNAVPGQVLHLHFTPQKLGDYPILCSQVCGIGHQRMQTMLRVVTPAHFEQWITERERQQAGATE